MLKSYLFTTVFSLCSVWLSAQNYSFSPGNEVYGVLEMDMYTEHYMYIGHDSPDSARITWRVIENTCPEGWDIQACDYQHCYTGLPNDGDMNPVPPGGQGYLRMIVNPFMIAGSGMLHLLIFPTGQPLNYVDAFYYFNTTALSSEEAEEAQSSLVITTNEILYTSPISGALQVYSLDGRFIRQAMKQQPTVRVEMDGLATGMYVLKLPTGESHVFNHLH
ncbi:MAG: T9SS type A sorting domain-containing protein [Flavobacteriales bacterium]|jgi:hypothetical protein